MGEGIGAITLRANLEGRETLNNEPEFWEEDGDRVGKLFPND